jgi:type III secretory pathway component EscS
MITGKSQFLQLTLSAITLVLVLGALSMIWPVIIAVLLGVLLLLQSFTADQEIAVLSWNTVSNLPIVFASLWRPGLPEILW